MADETPTDAPDGQQQEPDQQSPVDGTDEPARQPKTYDEKYVAELRKENARYRSQAKAAMSDADRAIAEAEERGKTAATAAYGQRLARAEFDSLAGRRNPKADTAAVLEFVDLSRFVGADGEPDTKAIKAAVDRLVPASNGAPDFDGGTRGKPAGGNDMNQMIRRAAGVA